MAVYSPTNINVNIENFQQAYTDLGLGPIPAGTSVANGVSALEKALIASLISNWPLTSGYPPSVPNQVNSGILEPWSANVGGTAPSCAITWMTNSFNGWQLPYSSTMLNQMAVEITTNIASNAGQTGYFYGQSSLTSSEKVYWGVAYTTAVVIGPPQNATGIIFAFNAVLGLD